MDSAFEKKERAKNEEIEIVHAPTKDEPFVVVYKPSGLPSAPLCDGDDSALSRVASLFPESLNVAGKKKVEHGLVHRIDTGTRGLVVVATEQHFYDSLIDAQKNGLFKKWYRAGISFVGGCAKKLGGFPECPFLENLKGAKNAKSLKENAPFDVSSFFRPFGPKGFQVRPVVEGGGRAMMKKSGDKMYTTTIESVSESEAVCSITAGYRHQVRCHLAWCGIPVKDDFVYNPDFKAGCNADSRSFDFCAFKIEFLGFSFEI